MECGWIHVRVKQKHISSPKPEGKHRTSDQCRQADRYPAVHYPLRLISLCPSGEGALVEWAGWLLGCLGGVTPRQQLIQPIDLVIGDAGEDIGEPSLWVDAVQLGRFDQGVGGRGRLAAALGADE